MNTLTIRCQAANRTGGRAEKHKAIRKNYFNSRSEQNKKLRSSLSSIAKDERERISSIWEAHKSFFANDTNEKDDTVVEPELVVEKVDLDSTNDFFEE